MLILDTLKVSGEKKRNTSKRLGYEQIVAVAKQPEACFLGHREYT